MVMEGSKMNPKGSQMVTRMVPKSIQNDPETPKWTFPGKVHFFDDFGMHFWAAPGPALVPKSV